MPNDFYRRCGLLTYSSLSMVHHYLWDQFVDHRYIIQTKLILLFIYIDGDRFVFVCVCARIDFRSSRRVVVLLFSIVVVARHLFTPRKIYDQRKQYCILRYA